MSRELLLLKQAPHEAKPSPFPQPAGPDGSSKNYAKSAEEVHCQTASRELWARRILFTERRIFRKPPAENFLFTKAISLDMIIQLVELVKIIFSGLSDKRFEQTSEDAVERVRERQGLPLWRVVKRVIPGTQGFIVTTRFKPKETVEFMHQMVSLYPELRVFRSDEPIPDKLYETDAGQCCYLVKVEPTRRAIEEMNVAS